MRVPGAGREAGFTILEALIAATVFLVVMVGAVSIYGSGARLYGRGQSKAGTQQNARIALEAAAREIRMAGYDRSGVIAGLATPTGVQTAESGRIVVLADVTGEGTLDQVTYELQGSQLVRTFASWTGGGFGGATSGQVAEGIATLAFTYFDGNDAAIAAPVPSGSLDDIRRINVALVTTETTSGAQQTFPLVVDVRVRNGG